MDPSAARRIIEALVDGVDPRAGEVLPSGSPIDSTDVVRALQVALATIDSQSRRHERNSVLPSNAGRPWRDDDYQELTELFDSGNLLAEISKAFKRTCGSITSPLVRLGKAPDRQSAFVANLHSPFNGGWRPRWAGDERPPFASRRCLMFHMLKSAGFLLFLLALTSHAQD